MQYNTGNYKKYMSRNPLKRKMVSLLNERIVSQIIAFTGCCSDDENKCVKVLDAGCGEGFIDHLLVERLGTEKLEITGLEYTNEALNIAKSMNPGVIYLQGNIYEIPFPDRSFDIVLCTEVLEHLEHPDKALQELQRVSKKYIYITVPHEPFFCMGNILALKNLNRLGNPIDHINHWTKISFIKFFTNCCGKGGCFSTSFPWIIAWKDVSL